MELLILWQMITAGVCFFVVAVAVYVGMQATKMLNICQEIARVQMEYLNKVIPQDEYRELRKVEHSLSIKMEGLIETVRGARSILDDIKHVEEDIRLKYGLHEETGS